MQVSNDRKQRLLNTALERIGCSLQQATICYILLTRELGGEEWTALSLEELARRPDRLCCSHRDALLYVKRAIAVGLIEARHDWFDAEHSEQLANEYRLNWPRITAIVETNNLIVA